MTCMKKLKTNSGRTARSGRSGPTTGYWKRLTVWNQYSLIDCYWIIVITSYWPANTAEEKADTLLTKNGDSVNVIDWIIIEMTERK